MKIVIYAMGQIFERYKKRINWDDIIALCDKNATDSSFFYNEYKIPVIPVKSLCDLEYDFIAVFSNPYFEEIKMDLVGQYFVPKYKVISWRNIVDEQVIDDFLLYRPYLKEKKYKRFLDVGMNVLPVRYLTKSELLMGEEIILDGIQSESAIYNQNLYDNAYENINECKKNYDVIFFFFFLQCMDGTLEKLYRRTKDIIVRAERKTISDRKAMQERLWQYGKVKCISTVEGDFWTINTEGKKETEDIAIYVIIHKKYNLYSNNTYIPLCVGGYREDGHLKEEEGANIAHLNKKINECTALYWIWKNTRSSYVGLNHYRRYFYNNEIRSMDNYLDHEHISDIMDQYDIILPLSVPLEKITIYEQIRNSMDPELCRKGYKMIRDKIKEKQPDYLKAFESVLNGHIIFNCNIFVTKRKILDQYCEWLFSFLIEAAEEIDVEGYDSYSQRVIGFFAERMWTVWLRKNRFRIKELPYVIIR